MASIVTAHMNSPSLHDQIENDPNALPQGSNSSKKWSVTSKPGYRALDLAWSENHGKRIIISRLKDKNETGLGSSSSRNHLTKGRTRGNGPGCNLSSSQAIE